MVIKGAIAYYRPTVQEYPETTEEPRVSTVTSGAQKVTWGEVALGGRECR